MFLGYKPPHIIYVSSLVTYIYFTQLQSEVVSTGNILAILTEFSQQLSTCWPIFKDECPVSGFEIYLRLYK